MSESQFGSDSSTQTGRRFSVLALALMMLSGLAVGAAVMWTLTRGAGAAPEQAAPAHEELPAGVVEMTVEAQSNVKVEMITASSLEMPTTIEVTGVVGPDETRLAHIRAISRGVVEQVAVRLGDRIGAQQALATMDSIELGQLIGEYQSQRANLRQVEADLDVRRRALERAEELIKLEAVAQQTVDLRRAEFKNAEAAVASQRANITRVEEQIHRFGVSDQQLADRGAEQAEGTHRVASHTILRAPFSGVIIKSDISIGEIVEPERELFTLANLTSVWVLGDVYEKDLAKVTAGTPVSIKVETYPDRTFSGQLTYVGDTIDPQTRTATVRVVVANPDNALKLDMFAKLSIPTKDRRTALSVPMRAVQNIDGQPVVFVRTSPTRFERRNVTLGATAGDVVEVRSGIAEGDSVVGAGSFYLKTAALRERIGDEH